MEHALEERLRLALHVIASAPLVASDRKAAVRWALELFMTRAPSVETPSYGKTDQEALDVEEDIKCIIKDLTGSVDLSIGKAIAEIRPQLSTGLYKQLTSAIKPRSTKAPLRDAEGLLAALRHELQKAKQGTRGYAHLPGEAPSPPRAAALTASRGPLPPAATSHELASAVQHFSISSPTTSSRTSRKYPAVPRTPETHGGASDIATDFSPESFPEEPHPVHLHLHQAEQAELPPGPKDI